MSLNAGSDVTPLAMEAASTNWVSDMTCRTLMADMGTVAAWDNKFMCVLKSMCRRADKSPDGPAQVGPRGEPGTSEGAVYLARPLSH